MSKWYLGLGTIWLDVVKAGPFEQELARGNVKFFVTQVSTLAIKLSCGQRVSKYLG